jgi:signal transduction histidine kinase
VCSSDLVAALPVIFWMYLAAGLIAWWRRPRNGIGLLLVWTGVTLWIIGIDNTTVPAFQVVGMVFTSTGAAALMHLLLAFPTGRLNSTLERSIVGGMYFVTIALQAPRYLFDPPADSPGFALIGVVGVVQLVCATALSVAAAAVLIQRLLRARPEHRRTLGLVNGYGVFVVLFVPLMAWAFSTWWPELGLIRDSIQIISIAIVPVVVVMAFLRAGVRRTAELEALSAWLGVAESSRTPIQTALADALGDPTLSVAYWSAELRSWVSAEGVVIMEQRYRPGRVRYEIVLSGAPVATIDYDGTLLCDPQEVERAANLVALALERERLSAELRASRQAVIESRERLVGAADAERRRISRGLHDGLQARLVLLGIDAQRIATAPADEVAQRATALREDVDYAAEELRAFVHDLVPPALIELGVVGAVEELLDSMPIPTRLDAAVPGRLGDTAETTAYLVVAEALTNVVKHAGATHCTVSLHADGTQLHIAVIDNGNGRVDPQQGTGLSGIADLVAASGGVSGVKTQPEGGTRLWARIPYAA